MMTYSHDAPHLLYFKIPSSYSLLINIYFQSLTFNWVILLKISNLGIYVLLLLNMQCRDLLELEVLRGWSRSGGMYAIGVYGRLYGGTVFKIKQKVTKLLTFSL